MSESNIIGWRIPGSFMVAIILTLLPMPDWTVWLRPAWVLMVLIYWTMVLPYRVNVGTAWCVGIVLRCVKRHFIGRACAGVNDGYLFCCRACIVNCACIPCCSRVCGYLCLCCFINLFCFVCKDF